MIARMILINKTRKRIAARCSTCFVFIGYFQESSPRTASSITTKKKEMSKKQRREKEMSFSIYITYFNVINYKKKNAIEDRHKNKETVCQNLFIFKATLYSIMFKITLE